MWSKPRGRNWWWGGGVDGKGDSYCAVAASGEGRGRGGGGVNYESRTRKTLGCFLRRR